jgi:hypothetical protein
MLCHADTDTDTDAARADYFAIIVINDMNSKIAAQPTHGRLILFNKSDLTMLHAENKF